MNTISASQKINFGQGSLAVLIGLVAGASSAIFYKDNNLVANEIHLGNPTLISNVVDEPKISPHQNAEIIKLLSSLKTNNDDKIPAFNMTNLGLQPFESLFFFDEFIKECVREHNGNRAEAIAWIATRLVEGNDEAFLNVLAGDAIHDAKTLIQVEDILKSQGNKYWHQFTEGALAQFALQNPKKGFLWLDNSKLEDTARSSLSLHYVEKIVD